MISATRKSLYPFVMGIFVLAGIFFTAGTAQSQCNSVAITNNMHCDVVLCLYGVNAVAPICSPSIPPGGNVSITIPTGWIPAGGVSQAGNRYPFMTTGCTVCYRQITSSTLACCAQVCYDPVACTIKINPCTSTICSP